MSTFIEACRFSSWIPEEFIEPTKVEVGMSYPKPRYFGNFPWQRFPDLHGKMSLVVTRSPLFRNHKRK